ncbi:hypothetical protein [Streptomyces sp. NPDC006274]|uniref:hypothetical protein n=1 Tax=unclassified Streptomyces TaxID=2593676 RepID=UPI0033B458BE
MIISVFEPPRCSDNEDLAAVRIAGDPALEGHAFGCLSLLAKASGRLREAI